MPEMTRKGSPGAPVDSRQLRREVARLKQKSDEILIRLDELVRQLEHVTSRGGQQAPGPKK
jgi:hypothetical protein